MKKTMLLLMAGVLCLGLLAGCAGNGPGESSPEATLPSGTDQAKTLEKAWEERFGTPIVWNGQDNPKQGVLNYGTFDGCVVLYDMGRSEEGTVSVSDPGTVYLGGSAFSYTGSFRMYAYKDGQLLDMREAFNKGYISRETLGAIAVAHQAQYDFGNLAVVEKAWKEHFGEDLYWCDRETDRYYGVRCYTTAGDDLILCRMLSEGSAELTVDGVSFTSEKPFELLFYHDGVIQPLEEAYEQGTADGTILAYAQVQHNNFEQ